MNGKSNDIFKFDFCGLPVSSFSKVQLIAFLKKAIKRKDNITIYGHSLGIFPRIMLQPETIQYIMDFDLYVSDGFKFHILGQKLGFPFDYRISLPEITFLSLRIANDIGASIFLLGASEENNNLACDEIKKNYPNIKNCFGINGYFGKEEEINIVDRINGSKPDLLFLGMPSPKKEKFLFKYKNKLEVGMSVLNGGMIDVLAGKKKLTSPLVKKMGLALFNRFIQDPKNKINQFIIYYPLINLYFIPILFWNYKIKKDYSFSFNNFSLIRMQLKKNNLLI